MWNLGIWFSGGIDSIRLKVVLDLEGLLQPERFYDGQNLVLMPG